ncbi:MAG: YggS family pyridoxal phosphate-dependent enzyme [Tuberibacillus sp.]
MSVKDNAQTIIKNIEEACAKSGRSVSEVKIIAVTKYVGVERAKEAVEAGIAHIGENRPEGLIEKSEALVHANITRHFIGTLQSRKVKDVLLYADFIHSLDRLSLAKEIEKRAERPVNCFVQVNVSGETSKHGLSIEDTLPFIESIKDFSKIRVVGLMTMAPQTDDHELLHSVFRKLKQLQLTVAGKGWHHAPCHELSMGMSGDYQIAVEEGATYVRIGTALVGKEG